MTTLSKRLPLRYRQIHLDFHTSEAIPNVGADFNAADFVATLKSASVDSVTIFAKCHHGWSYYPTTVGAPHPNLARPDLLGEMMQACAAADIETPVYITVQWDERTARLHPEWRAISATNRYHNGLGSDNSGLQQLSPAWHTLCLNHAGLRQSVLDQAREVASRYHPPGLFFDIVLTPDCVCQECIASMLDKGLDPANPEHRLANDEAVNERFRQETSAALFAEFPAMRVFYNCGHIHKQGKQRFSNYTHLELESLPTGGWGYDHFPSSARYAAPLGFDFLGQTGKFHTSWGEFGGFKQPEALDYECAQMAALGAKCLVGDQLHPSGAINWDTYASIAPAYARIAKLEPYLRGAKQVSEVAILSAEFFHPAGARNHSSDDGAAQMLQELKQPFDVIDPGASFDQYRLIILPDDIPVDAALASRFADYVGQGGKLLLSGRSGLTPDGTRFAIDAGIAATAEAMPFNPSYVRMRSAGQQSGLPRSPFVVNGEALLVTVDSAEVLADIVPPYFNRSWRAFSSHQHSPDDPAALPMGPAVTLSDTTGYVAYPIFRLYHAMGQPLYKYLVRRLLDALLPDRALETSLPSGGRATLTHQADDSRYVVHLLYGAPQLRGKAVPVAEGGSRGLEMIEDIPTLGPVTVDLRLAQAPKAISNVLSGESVPFHTTASGAIRFTLPSLHIHAALAVQY